MTSVTRSRGSLALRFRNLGTNEPGVHLALHDMSPGERRRGSDHSGQVKLGGKPGPRGRGVGHADQPQGGLVVREDKEADLEPVWRE